MKFYFFHLMPYGALDLDYVKTHESAWLTLPNSYYDPVQGHRLYRRYIDELRLADALGFDGVCVNEHHETAYGLMPVPGVIAGALACTTTSAKICVLGRALPLLNNPLVVAEEYAMLDNISGGRLIAGFVRGIGVEYHASMTNPGESHGRFQEAHDLILRAWTEPGPFAFEGKYYNFLYVNLWPRPYQKPHPEIWIPSQGSAQTIDWTSHPDRKYTFLHTFSPITAVRKFVGQYTKRCEDYGYSPSSDQLGWALPLYVAETDAIAEREARAHIEDFFNKFLRAPTEYKLPPGYTSLESAQAVLTGTLKVREQHLSFEKLIELGMFICGSPATVAERLERHHREMGIGRLVTMLQFGTLPRELTEKNMRLFAGEVMPRLRPLGERA